MGLQSTATLLILIAITGFLGGGCATRNASQTAFDKKSYRKLLERQQATARLEDEAIKELPEMTASEYEIAGDNYFRQDKLTMAFVQYDKALHLDPAHSRIRYKKGLLFLKKRLDNSAMEEFQTILGKDENFALAHEGMGHVFFQKGNISEAEKSFQKAISLDRKLWNSHNFLGVIHDYQKRHHDAIASYKTSLSIKNNILALNNLGMSYYLNGNYDHAVSTFTQAIREGYRESKIYNNLGVVLAKLGRYEDALNAFIKGGDKAKAYNNLGVIYLAEQKYKEAIAAFENAIASDPSYYSKANENLKIAQKALQVPTLAPGKNADTPLDNEPLLDMLQRYDPAPGKHQGHLPKIEPVVVENDI